MNILIVDDNPKRYERLLLKLQEIGVQRGNILFANCTDEAYEKLKNQYFDLMILDILIPLYPESEAKHNYSQDLLVNLTRDPSLNKPGYILGITADKTLVDSTVEQFESNTRMVLEFSESQDEWINRTINCVSYIQNLNESERQNPVSYGIDLLIICALENPELEEVLNLPWHWKSPRPIGDSTFVYDGHFNIKDRNYSVCATHALRMGMVETAILSTHLINKLHPKLIVMCGICAGIEGKVNIGDVLLADPVWDFQSGKSIQAGFKIAPHQLSIPREIRSIVTNLSSSLKTQINEIFSNFKGNAPSCLPDIEVGPVVSGSAVITDNKIIEEIKQQHRNLMGLEMEIYGMYAAVAAAEKPRPVTFALKAVCDFANEEKNDNYQQFAAYMSANILRLIMENYGSQILSDR